MTKTASENIPKSLGHHVYVLFSQSRNDLVKVGRSNGSARIRGLIKMHYADVPDWECYKVIPLDSRQAAVAVEAMAHARLINEELNIGRFKWTRLPDKKQCFADECFMCAPSYAVSVVVEMVSLYKDRVC
jgi:hypothetical protein